MSYFLSNSPGYIPGLASAADIRRDVAGLAKAPIRRPVSEIAAESVWVRSASGGRDRWSPDTTPYMREPMDRLASRKHECVCFVGPARTGKSQGLVLGSLAYVALADPADMLIVAMTQDKATKLSKKEIARLFNDSPDLKECLSHRPNDNNTFSKTLRRGNIIYIGWPSASQLSAETVKYAVLTDFDRMPLFIGHEGSPFQLAKKRIQTFLSSGTVLVESSPGYEITNPDWEQSTPHEAPPTFGSFEIYNLGDRNRLYWRCPDCGDYFMEPMGFSGFDFNHVRDDRGVTVPSEMGEPKLICTANGCLIPESAKTELLSTCQWEPDPVGDHSENNYATYWLSGAAAKYQSWRSIIQNYLKAEKVFDTTGNEQNLRNSLNLDMGAAYLPRKRAVELKPHSLQERAVHYERGVVPAKVRFLLGVVDVQAGKDARFVVHVIGFGPDLQSWIVDRFAIREFDGKKIDPAIYPEHWRALLDELLLKAYPLEGDEKRAMRLLRVGCDMHGAEGVSSHAYDFVRFLKRHKLREPESSRFGNLSQRFRLLRGTGHRSAPRYKTTYPESESNKQRKANARGDIPVIQFNSNLLKDELNNAMKRDEPGPGYMWWGDWLKRPFYEELTAEIKTPKGSYEKKTPKAANEATDLYNMARALCLALGAESINWKNPAKAWAREWDRNSEIITLDDSSIRETRKDRVKPMRRERKRVRFSIGS